jgi:protein-S-isoprenylcysteine O-methyltransferase Ste14
VTTRRHVFALVLPVTVTIVVPALILAWSGAAVGWGLPRPLGLFPVLAGCLLVAAGLAGVAWTVSLFATEGEGTLAPWDPTRMLVVRGPYRHVRNPMIASVGLILLGEAALAGSPWLLAWVGVFAAINAVYIPLVEEPGLVRRFDDEYLVYRRRVPRWIPRRAPCDPGSS